MRHVALKAISVTGFDGPLLSTVNVSGTACHRPRFPDAITAKEPYVLRKSIFPVGLVQGLPSMSVFGNENAAALLFRDTQQQGKTL